MTRLRIGKLAAARQLQLQECPGAFECDRAAAHDVAALPHGNPGSAINIVPEALDGWMRSTPFFLKLLHLGVGELLRLEFSPSIEAAHISVSKIRCFADGAFRRILVKSAIRYAKDLAGGDAIRLIARITRSVEAAIAVQLPLLAGSPRQYAGFNAAEVGADSLCPGAAIIMLRLQSPTTESGCAYRLRTC